MYVRHVPHAGPLQLWSGGAWNEVWVTLDAKEMILDGASRALPKREGSLSLRDFVSEPSVPSSAWCAKVREHTFDLQVRTGAAGEADSQAIITLAAPTRSALNIWVLRLRRALADLGVGTGTTAGTHHEGQAPGGDGDAGAEVHSAGSSPGEAGAVSMGKQAHLVSPSYPVWVEGAKPVPYRGHLRKPSFQWKLSDQDFARIAAQLPLDVTALPAKRTMYGRGALVDAPFDAENPWAAAGHYRGSQQGVGPARMQALIEEEQRRERARAAADNPFDERQALIAAHFNRGPEQPVARQATGAPPPGGAPVERWWAKQAVEAAAPELATARRADLRAATTRANARTSAFPPSAAQARAGAQRMGQRPADRAAATPSHPVRASEGARKAATMQVARFVGTAPAI